jgi:hypothetical protein
VALVGVWDEAAHLVGVHNVCHVEALTVVIQLKQRLRGGRARSIIPLSPAHRERWMLPAADAAPVVPST